MQISRRHALLLLFLSWLTVVALHAVSFRLPYFGEDFEWLEHISGRDIFGALRSEPGVFFRPLATSLPYFLAEMIPHGRLWWKVIAMLLLSGSGLLFWLWLRERLRNDWLALVLVLVVFWWYQPSQAYGLLYPNAFDYVLNSFFLLGFFVAAQRRKFGWAMAAMVAGCLSKEMMLALPLCLWWWRKEFAVPQKWLVAITAITPAFLFFHHGFSFGGKKMGGFSLATRWVEIQDNFLGLAGKTFTGNTGSANVDRWYFIASALLILTASLALWEQRWRDLRRATGYIILAAVFFLPLVFLRNFRSEHLGPIYWVFLIVAAAEMLGANRAGVWRSFLAPVFALAAVGVIFSWGVTAGGVRERYIARADLYFQVLLSTQEKLVGCGRYDQVVLEGLEKVMDSENDARHAAMGLQWINPGAQFFLLRNPGPPYDNPIPNHMPQWAERAQITGHPFFSITRGQGASKLRVQPLGTALCQTSSEAMYPGTGTRNIF